jgi:hypothetical protein
LFCLELTPLRQQDQLGGRVALRPNPIGERDEGLYCCWNLGHDGDDGTQRILNPCADLAFLRRLQQLALADVLEIDTDEVDVLAGDTRLMCLFGTVVLLEIILVNTDRLLAERFGFHLLK